MSKATEAHKSAVAALGCIICGAPAAIHHTNTFAMGQRNDDMHVLPLCPYHHQQGPFGHAIHNGKRTFEKTYGTEEQLLERVKQLLENHV